MRLDGVIGRACWVWEISSGETIKMGSAFSTLFGFDEDHRLHQVARAIQNSSSFTVVRVGFDVRPPHPVFVVSCIQLGQPRREPQVELGHRDTWVYEGMVP